MSKYIIDVGDAYTEYICGKGDMLCLPVRINEFEDNWLNTDIPLTPYTEPDFEQIKKLSYAQGYIEGFANAGVNCHEGCSHVEEAYQRGYETAKHKCNIQAEKDLREVGERHYQKGLSDAWDAARKIAISEESGGLTCREMQRIFCTDETDEIFDMSASEAIERIRQYEQEQEEIKVGDEVAFHHDDGRPDTVVVVTYIGQDGFIDGMDGRGTQYAHKNPKKWTKTGRHFPEIAAVLAKMKEES